MENDKLLSMSEAIARHVRDGMSIVMGTGLEGMIPFAAGHEIIRQRRRDLTLIGPISDILFDQLIGAGCLRRVVAAWVGNVSSGSAYNFRRAVEQGRPRPLEVEDHSNFTIALALHAAALGIPFIPTFSTLGTDILKNNPNLKEFSSPFGGEKIVAVRAIEPDLAIVQAQRADAQGNAHIWGNLGVTLDAVRGSKSVIVVAEEIVASEVIASDPNRTLIPGFLVSAVVAEPWGAHPSPVPGYYNRDHGFYGEYHEQTRTERDFAAWLDKWVLGVGGRDEYLARLGWDRISKLKVKNPAPAALADFGY